MRVSTIGFVPDQTRPRKQLAHLISEALGETVTYMGAPSFAYRIGGASLDRNWELNTTELDKQQVGAIITTTQDAGYTIRSSDAEDGVGLSLAFPTTGWEETTAGKLEALLAAKSPLITKALGILEAPMQVDEEAGRVVFAWFATTPNPEVIEAAACLIERMIAYAKSATRINPTPTTAVNEKYAMRCWLLRLGMIGPETKPARQVLLRRLDGNAAWKTPPEKHVENSDVNL